MEIKLFDSELKVMDVLWRQGDTTAKEMAQILNKEIGWSKTTTYTVIKKCIDKHAIERIEPKFVCRARVTKEQAQAYETKELIEKMYDGAEDQLIANLLGRNELSKEEIDHLKELVKRLEE